MRKIVAWMMHTLKQKIVIGGLAAAVLIGFIVYSWTEARILIYRVDVSSEVAAKLPSPDIMTRRAVKAVPSTIAEIMRSWITAETGSDPVDARGCSSVIQIGDLDYLTFYLQRRKESRYQGDLLDLPIEKGGLSLARAVSAVKRLLNIEFIEVVPVITAESDGFVIEIHLYGPDDSHESLSFRARTLEEIEKTFNEAIALSLAPELIGLTKEVMKPGDLSQELRIAENIFMDRDQKTFIMLQQLTSLGDGFSGEISNRAERDRAAYDIATELLEINNFEALGPLENVSVLNAINAIVQFTAAEKELMEEVQQSDEVVPGYSKELARIASAVHEAALNELVLDARRIAQLGGPIEQLVLSSIYYTAGRKDKSAEALSDALEQADAKFRGEPGQRAKIYILTAIWLGYFDLNDQASAALDALKKSLVDYRSALPTDILRMIEAVEANLDLRRGRSDKAMEFVESGRALEFPCVGLWAANMFLGETVYAPQGAAPLSDKEARKFAEAVSKLFSAIEEEITVDFSFVNNWGILLAALGDYMQASDKYESARKLPGDHNWAYLNHANAAFAAGDYRRSRQLYERSLEYRSVENGIIGFLHSLAALGESDQFLSEYDRYSWSMEGMSVDRRIALSKLALIHSCRIHRSPESLKPLWIGPQELALFDFGICSWPVSADRH